MFSRKALQVKVVKSDKTPQTSGPTEPSFEKKVDIIATYINKSFVRAGLAVIAYVAADTAREVLIARADKHEEK